MQSSTRRSRRAKQGGRSLDARAATVSLEAVRADVEVAERGLLGDNVKSIAPHAPLMEMGLDSLAAPELVRDLSSRFELQLPATRTCADKPRSVAGTS